MFGLPGITQVRSEKFSKFTEGRHTPPVEMCDHLDGGHSSLSMVRMKSRFTKRVSCIKLL